MPEVLAMFRLNLRVRLRADAVRAARGIARKYRENDGRSHSHRSEDTAEGST
jgi:hypothetical protein